MSRPDASLPKDEPKVDVVTYHARTSDLVVGVVSCDNTDLQLLISIDICDELGRSDSLFYTPKRTKVAACHTNDPQYRSQQ